MENDRTPARVDRSATLLDREDPAPEQILLVAPSAARAAVVLDLLHRHPTASPRLTTRRTLEDACAHLATHPVDCVLVDLAGSDALGTDAVTAIRAVAQGVALVVLTDAARDGVALDAIRAGAHDYLDLDDIDPRRLWRSLEYALTRTAADRRTRYERTHDLLTGLGNGRGMVQALRTAAARLTADGPGMAVLSIDLDGFADINRTLGHDVGDELLIRVAERIRGQLQQTHAAARTGGDAFVVVCEQVEGAEAARALASRLGDVLSAPIWLRGHDVPLRASIGVAYGTGSAVDPERLLHDADSAMSVAKARRGRPTSTGADPGDRR